MNELEKFTIEDVDKAISERLREENITRNEGRAILLLGQPAAGKSRIAYTYVNKYKCIEIDGDLYRENHPNFDKIQEVYKKDASKHTGAFASAVCERMIDECTKNKANILIHGTGRSYDTIKGTVDKLKDKGYEKINIVVVTCPLKVSMYSIYKRYYEVDDATNRFTDLSHVKLVLSNLPKNLERAREEKLVDSITFIARNQEGIMLQKKSPELTLLKHLVRPLKEQEQSVVDEVKQIISNKMKEDAPKEIEKIEDVISDIRADIKTQIEECTKRLSSTKSRGFSR